MQTVARAHSTREKASRNFSNNEKNGRLSGNVSKPTPACSLQIQRKASCPCGGGCPACRSFGIQAKLAIGQPNDIYEQEADRVADQICSMPDPHVQRKPG